VNRTTASRWDAFGTSIFSVMSARARELQAVNLSQGFPDFDAPEIIKEAACDAIRRGENQYAPAIGIAPLRQAIARRYEQRYGLAYDADREITICTGATEALFCVIQALCNPGDEVLTFEPFYDSYPACAASAGARLVAIPLTPPEWKFDPSALAAAVTPRTKVLLINTPHNPTGRMFTAEEMAAIAQIAVRHDLFVVTDEVYEELFFEAISHQSLAALSGMRERTVIVSSTSKSFSVTGWKIGYTLASEAITAAIRKVHQFTVFCSATPLQWGALAAFDLGGDYFAELRQSYRVKRDRLMAILQSAGFVCTKPQGTYFIVADYSGIDRRSDCEFAEWFVQSAGIACIPLSVFYERPEKVTARWVRFAFCKKDETLAAASERLQRWQSHK
jgi:aspartate/methionine/tyrosine aminotransferase